MILSLLVGCYSLDGFFFQPGTVEAYTLGGDVIPASCQELVSFDGEAGTLYGAWAHQPGAEGADCEDTAPNPDAPMVVYFHGNAANIDEYWPQVEFHWALGHEVFIVDYRGYGRSWGDPDFDGVIADGRAAVAHVEDRTGLDPTELVYVGLSLGGFVAVHLIEDAPPGVLITEDMFANTQKMLDDGTDLDLPSGWFFTEHYDNLGPLRRMPPTIPTLVTHGAEDDYIRPEHAELVYAAVAAESKELFLVPGVGHADAVADAPEIYAPRIDCWVRQDCADE